jgi:hypothetical protein
MVQYWAIVTQLWKGGVLDALSDTKPFQPARSGCRASCRESVAGGVLDAPSDTEPSRPARAGSRGPTRLSVAGGVQDAFAG